MFFRCRFTQTNLMFLTYIFIENHNYSLLKWLLMHLSIIIANNAEIIVK